MSTAPTATLIDESYYVHIINDATGESVKCMGPSTERRANKTADGVLINLDHEGYCVKVTTCGHPLADPEVCLLCAVGAPCDAE